MYAQISVQKTVFLLEIQIKGKLKVSYRFSPAASNNYFFKRKEISDG
jgi:hypothetical protein